MKRKTITVLIISAIVATGTLSSLAVAAPGKGRDCEDRQERMEMKHEKRLDVMADVLDLTDSQQKQIRAIHEQERTEMEGVREQLRAGREQMRNLIEADTFDEAAVRSLAKSQESLKTELFISRAKVKHETFQLLTAEQQELAEKIKPLMGKKGKKGKHHSAKKGF